MSNGTNWTRGNWSVRDCPLKGAHTDAEDNGRIKLIDYNDGEYAGTLAIVQTEESGANANLFAAAPELYDALVWAMRFVDQVRAENPAPVGGGEDIAYDEAVAALAKARGEQP